MCVNEVNELPPSSVGLSTSICKPCRAPLQPPLPPAAVDKRSLRSDNARGEKRTNLDSRWGCGTIAPDKEVLSAQLAAAQGNTSWRNNRPLPRCENSHSTGSSKES